jgi:hypothetical protein
MKWVDRASPFKNSFPEQNKAALSGGQIGKPPK